MQLEDRYDPVFVARMALREKQVQQSYRPIIQIHKWFARRPGSVFRSLLLGEFGGAPLAEDYFQGHQIDGAILDPFMGGGTTVFEAARIGLSVSGSDVNPMAYWTVRQAVAPLDFSAFEAEAEQVVSDVRDQIGSLYETTCSRCGEIAPIKYFLLVKVVDCPHCHEQVDLFPGYRIAEAVRHPLEVYHCPQCDELREVEKSPTPACPVCSADLKRAGARRGRVTCRHCHESFAFAKAFDGAPRHRMYGIEYQCGRCYGGIKGRQFKTPDREDREREMRAVDLLARYRDRLRIPNEEILPGDETNRLLRWGYRYWCELFTDRQLLGLGLMMERIAEVRDREVRFALSTVFSDFLRYQNTLCRYDTYALKCQDIFAVHGFPVALMACENSLLGIPKVGSGAFVHFVAKYLKAKEYAKHPYETSYASGRKVLVPIANETIERPLVGAQPSAVQRAAWLSAAPSQHLQLAPCSLDGVFTDPPYFDMVQYAELMDFCFVWLRRLLGEAVPFEPTTTRMDEELTGNTTRSRGMREFASGLSAVFCRAAAALKPGAPLVFTYHHNDPEAYVPLIVAILDAGLTCTATLVAPGEMSASLHIAGTKSSILDSVFVCRKPGHAPTSTESVAQRVQADVEAMRLVPYEPSRGDVACLEAGHVAADAIRILRDAWDVNWSIEHKFAQAGTAVARVKDEGKQV